MRFISLILSLVLFQASVCFGAVTVTVNGASHTIPQTNEKGWGANVTAWIQAISANTLQPSGGTFTLTSDVNFGASYGLKSAYFSTRTANPSGAGIFRLANTESIGWRNAANSGNLLLTVTGSDVLTFNGIALGTATSASFQDSTFSLYDNGDATKLLAFQVSGVTTGTTRTLTVPDASTTIVGHDATQTLTNKTMSGASNTFSNIPNSATTAVATNTVSTIVARDGSGNFAAGTITAALTGNASTASALAADPADCAADTYATSIVAAGTLTCATVTNAGLAGSIAFSKLAATTADRAIVSNGSGVLAAATTTATEIGYVNGVTSAIQTQLDARISKNLTTTTGDIIYASSANTPARLGVGSDGQVLTLASGLPSWATPAASPVFVAPTMQTFTSGSSTYNKNYAFVISSGSATVDATYTNNGVTYTVYATVASATLVYMRGNGAPAASGTLTKASGTGDASLTFSSVLSPLYLVVTAVGGGGGGAGGGTTAVNGNVGNATTFGSSLITAGAGAGGAGTSGGDGGSATATGLKAILAIGGYGGSGNQTSNSDGYQAGPQGGSSYLGGAGSGNGAAGAGTNGKTNTGGGGGGGGFTTALSGQVGGGGGAGGSVVRAYIPSPAATYAYAVGAGGAGVSGGTSGEAGGAGGSGVVIVEEFYR